MGSVDLETVKTVVDVVMVVLPAALKILAIFL